MAQPSLHPLLPRARPGAATSRRCCARSRQRGLLQRRTAPMPPPSSINLALLARPGPGSLLLGNRWWVLLLAVPLGGAHHPDVFLRSRRRAPADRLLAPAARPARPVPRQPAARDELTAGGTTSTTATTRTRTTPTRTPTSVPAYWSGPSTRPAGRTGLHGWLTRNQAWLFFPLLLLEGFNLKVSSIRYLPQPPFRCAAPGSSALIIVHHVAVLRVAAVGDVAGTRRWPSPPCTTCCSDCTWAACSRPTTRAWRCRTVHSGGAIWRSRC